MNVLLFTFIGLILIAFGVRCWKAYKEMKRVEGSPLPDYRSYSYNSISRDRIKVVWKEDGGEDEDGIIYIRDGATGLCMGGHRYVQARIIVDKRYYLKGMVVLRSEWPEKNDGFDIVVCTAKSKNEPDKVFRPIEDWNNPFNLPEGKSTTNIYDDHNHLSAINVVSTPEEWAKWTSGIASLSISKTAILK